jgi:hypothetical protein
VRVTIGRFVVHFETTSLGLMGRYKRSSQMCSRSNSARCDSFIANATVRKQHVQRESNVPSSFSLRWNVVEGIRSATAGPSRAPESQGRSLLGYISTSTLCVLYTTQAAYQIHSFALLASITMRAIMMDSEMM